MNSGRTYWGPQLFASNGDQVNNQHQFLLVTAAFNLLIQHAHLNIVYNKATNTMLFIETTTVSDGKCSSTQHPVSNSTDGKE